MLLRRDRAAAMPFIMLATLIDMVAIGLIIPVLPALVGTFTASQAEQALWYGAVTFAFGFANFFASPVLGALSDRHGRRPVLLIGFCGLATSFLLTAIVTALWMLILVRLVSGAMQANMSVSNAYVADITAPEDRARRFGMLGAMFGLGFILGPVMGGLLGAIDLRLPFFAAGSLALVNLLNGYFVLPESLPPERRRPFSWKRAHPIGAVIALRAHPGVLPLFGVLALYQVAHDANPATFTYYTMLKFHWDARQVGMAMGFVGLMVAIAQGGVIRAALPRLGERRAVLLGFSMMTAGFAALAFASAGWMVYAIFVPFSLTGFTMPALRAILSRKIGPDAQGELQGALTSMQGMTATFAPVLMTSLFSLFTSQRAPRAFPGAPFLAASLLALVALGLFARLTGAGDESILSG
jgi:DHA1 family tetracycline resistance protein-like MFS transporter